MGDFNFDLVKSGTHGPTSAFLEGFTSLGFYPLISLPTRLTDDNHDRPGTATLLDNIWTNNVCREVASGVVTVRISDHLPVFTFVGGAMEEEESGGGASKGRRVNESRIGRFKEELGAWSFDVARAMGVEGNVAKFRNEFRDMYDAAFPWADRRKGRKDREKPWLDDEGFKELLREKNELYSRKLRG